MIRKWKHCLYTFPFLFFFLFLHASVPWVPSLLSTIFYSTMQLVENPAARELVHRKLIVHIILLLHYDPVCFSTLSKVIKNFTLQIPVVWLDFLVEVLFMSGHSLKWVAAYLFNASLAYGLAPKLTSSLALMVWFRDFIAKNISKHWLLLILRRKCYFLKTQLHCL